MNKRHLIDLGLTGTLVMLLAGCATGPGRLAADYGSSYQLARFNQTLDPAAEKNLEPVYGFDGVAAQHALEKYHKSFEKPPAPPVYALSIGTIK